MAPATDLLYIKHNENKLPKYAKQRVGQVCPVIFWAFWGKKDGYGGVVVFSLFWGGCMARLVPRELVVTEEFPDRR